MKKSFFTITSLALSLTLLGCDSQTFRDLFPGVKFDSKDIKDAAVEVRKSAEEGRKAAEALSESNKKASEEEIKAIVEVVAPKQKTDEEIREIAKEVIPTAAPIQKKKAWKEVIGEFLGEGEGIETIDGVMAKPLLMEYEPETGRTIFVFQGLNAATESYRTLFPGQASGSAIGALAEDVEKEEFYPYSSYTKDGVYSAPSSEDFFRTTHKTVKTGVVSALDAIKKVFLLNDEFTDGKKDLATPTGFNFWDVPLDLLNRKFKFGTTRALYAISNPPYVYVDGKWSARDLSSVFEGKIVQVLYNRKHKIFYVLTDTGKLYRFKEENFPVGK